jgi:hypothetical protein
MHAVDRQKEERENVFTLWLSQQTMDIHEASRKGRKKSIYCLWIEIKTRTGSFDEGGKEF